MSSALMLNLCQSQIQTVTDTIMDLMTPTRFITTTRTMPMVVLSPCGPPTTATTTAMTLPPTHLLNLDAEQVFAVTLADLAWITPVKLLRTPRFLMVSNGLELNCPAHCQ